ncbi:sensor histidine kinase [Schaalia suimastitidis]|uniref:sensor histidine kinase n=1 Tax=Schaalia suimastitidis TaxID=121163 RepID=UPI000409E708|nr:ATP-binding protein [Schaalia suimastitidis]
MPEILTLVIVALLSLAVGAGGVAAFLMSERQQEREDTVEVDPDALNADALAILTSLPGISIVVDKNNRVMQACAAAYAKGLVRGSDLTHPRIVNLVETVRKNGRGVTENLELPRSSITSSATLTFRTRVSPLPGHRVIILAEDLTQERRNEATRRDFTANVSHELKTPVGAIRLLAETISKDPADAAAVQHFAPRLMKESERLSNLVQDIIDLSRLEAPDSLSEPELVDIDEVVTAAADALSVTAQSAGITVVTPTDASGAKVWGNANKLATAVRNLLDNAVRYSDSGSRVSIGVSIDEALVRIAVVDAGIGIGEEEQQRIFERFYRVDPARSRATGGTGLGLSIVKHVASDHGGTVTLWSKPGRGSTFTLVLPQADEGGPDTWEDEEV